MGMAYIPPHKRHSKDEDKPSPTPESLLIPQFHKKGKHSLQGGKKIIYADDAISRWFAVGLADDDHTHFPSSTRLEPISLKSFEQKLGEPPLTLVTKENKEDKRDVLKSPWESVAEDVQEDLLSSFQNLRNVMEECQELQEVKQTLVARFGKILFHGSPSVSIEAVKRSSVSETTLRLLKRSFYTNVPLSYMKYVTNEAVPKIGLNFEEEKELYHVKLSDSMWPDSTLSCKCRVLKDCKTLELYKIELNQVRHLVLDISFLDRKLDLRLMLCTKRILTALTDDEKHSIRSLINSAVLDSDVKGGLRWPLGKESSGERYTVVGVWHTNAKAFRSSSMRLKVRHADRFDFRTSAGEVTGEVSLKMTGIVSQLREQSVQIDLVTEMLKDNIKLIWDCFLCCDCPLS